MAFIQSSLFLLSLSLFQLLFSGVFSSTFTIINECSYTVWPGILSGAGTAALQTTGFELPPGHSYAVDAPTGWSGRLWGRTGCSRDAATGKFACLTGDCGSSAVECAGAGALPPATLAEFTLGGYGGLDFYDVSLVDGYNLALTVSPQVVGPTNYAGSTNASCAATGCVVDLNPSCPAELKVVAREGEGGSAVACRSACEAFGDPQYCCSGAYGTPDTCKPSAYSEFFKSACPRAYSYAYDDGTSTFTCASADYVITFCPSSTPSVKSSNSNEQQYPEAVQASAGFRETAPSFVAFAAVAVAAIWTSLRLV